MVALTILARVTRWSQAQLNVVVVVVVVVEKKTIDSLFHERGSNDLCVCAGEHGGSKREKVRWQCDVLLATCCPVVNALRKRALSLNLTVIF